MALPKKKIQYSVHTLEIPSTKKQIKVRPFTGKEEKLFLLAKEEKDLSKIRDVVIQVIDNCLLESPTGYKTSDLALFDIEYLFLQLFGISNDPQIDFIYNNTDCEDVKCPDQIKCRVNINDIHVQFPDIPHDGKIILYDNSEIGMLGIKLKFPTVDILKSLGDLSQADEMTQLHKIIFECLEYFFDNEQVYKPDRSNSEEINEALEMISGFTREQNKKIQEFFDSMPVLKHTVEIKCPRCERSIQMTVQGLQDFFL